MIIICRESIMPSIRMGEGEGRNIHARSAPPARKAAMKIMMARIRNANLATNPLDSKKSFAPVTYLLDVKPDIMP